MSRNRGLHRVAAGPPAASRDPRAAGIAPPETMFYNRLMNFALTSQMIDKIGFAMEDQKEKYAVDVDSGSSFPSPP